MVKFNLSTTLVLNFIIVFMMFFLPSINLLIEYYYKALSKCFKNNMKAFKFHMYYTCIWWLIWVALVVLLFTSNEKLNYFTTSWVIR